MVTVGETVAVPEVPLVVKLVPVQEVALAEDQVSVEDGLAMAEEIPPTDDVVSVLLLPEGTEVGDAVKVAVGAVLERAVNDNCTNVLSSENVTELGELNTGPFANTIPDPVLCEE
mgnify:CR=1 FL=1